MQKSPQHTKKGFTLIETLVSIFLLLLAITGPLTFAQSSLQNAFYARDQIIAFYLAQDAIETIKHMRDNHALKQEAGRWLHGLDKCEPGSANGLNQGSLKICRIDTSNDKPKMLACSNPDSCGTLYYNDADKTYTHTSGGNTKSKYSRVVYITELVEDREAQVIVKMVWTPTVLGPREIIVQENIYNQLHSTIVN